MSAAPDRLGSHRFWATLVGLPLIATLFIPWSLDGSELGAFELADAMEHLGWGLMPFVGVAFLIAAFAPMPSIVRRGLLAATGVSALVLGCVLLGDEQTQYHLPGEFLERPWLIILALVWLAAAGLEMAMHARPRSRGISIAAFTSLTLALASFAVPMRVSRSSQRSLLEAIVKELDGRHNEDALFALVILLLLFVAWLQALRRIGKDRDKAAQRRFRSSWITYMLLPVPFLGLYAMLLWNVVSRPRLLAEAHNVWAFVFAGAFGGALGIANTATLFAGWKVPRFVRHAALAGVAGAGIFLAIRAALPDAREARAHAFIDAIGEATILGLRGQPVPERFLGGYEEFDLRAAPAALEGHAEPGAPLRLVATAVRYSVSQPGFRSGGWAVSFNDESSNDELRWTGATNSARRATDVDVLADVDAALAALVGFAFDESATCLPGLTASERASLGDAFDEESEALDEMLCREDSTVSPLFAETDDTLRGSIDRYRVVVELPSGEQMTFEGALLFESRLWVGPPAASPSTR